LSPPPLPRWYRMIFPSPSHTQICIYKRYITERHVCLYKTYFHKMIIKRQRQSTSCTRQKQCGSPSWAVRRLEILWNCPIWPKNIPLSSPNVHFQKPKTCVVSHRHYITEKTTFGKIFWNFLSI
jgi:hypothetical protein